MENRRKQLIDVFLKKNSELNLSAIRDFDGVLVKHVQDSLKLNEILKLKNGARVCDIGTGWGFPLLPLAITNWKVQFIWIDARRKKTDAVNDMISQLDIRNAKCIWGRIEEIASPSSKHYQTFNYVTARAVWYVDKVIDWSYWLLKQWGHFVFYKEFKEEEKLDLLRICKIKRLKLEHEFEYKLFEWDIRRVIYIIKKL